MDRSLNVLAAIAVAAAASACGIGPLRAEARDTWARTYTLGKSGEVSITNVNGRVEIEGVDGNAVDVQAERIAHGATEQLARDLLPKISITDKSTPNLIALETGRIGGMLIGASFEVRYHVKMPRAATVRAVTVNGGVDVRSMSGRVSVRTTNGGIRGDNLSGGLDAKTINGGVRVSFSAVSASDINVATVNGGIRLGLPESARVTVNASWLNGGFDGSGLNFDVRENAKRHFEGLLNGGGTPVNATTVNGGVRITSTANSSKDADTESQ